MHLDGLRLFPERYPKVDRYPFNQALFQQTRQVAFPRPVVLFVGENGAGKTTLLRALARKCGIHIWQGLETTRCETNRYEDCLHECIELDWAAGPVPGSYFGSDLFRSFAESLDAWAAADPGLLNYFGGKSLLTQSHGQSLLSYFRARYQRRGLYLLDEPETALSPRSQIALLRLMMEMSAAGHAQFVVATHSPILLACPGAAILSFDGHTVAGIAYEDTDHYRLYREFLKEPERFLR